LTVHASKPRCRLHFAWQLAARRSAATVIPKTPSPIRINAVPRSCFPPAIRLGLPNGPIRCCGAVTAPVPGETPPRTPRVLGVVVWAWRRGHHYGTIVLGLEKSKVVDLLPDREAATLAAWLRAYPGVNVAQAPRDSMLTPYIDFVSRRWAEGCRNGGPTLARVGRARLQGPPEHRPALVGLASPCRAGNGNFDRLGGGANLAGSDWPKLMAKSATLSEPDGLFVIRLLIDEPAPGMAIKWATQSNAMLRHRVSETTMSCSTTPTVLYPPTSPLGCAVTSMRSRPCGKPAFCTSCPPPRAHRLRTKIGDRAREERTSFTRCSRW
jgi:hypothetical protein